MCIDFFGNEIVRNNFIANMEFYLWHSNSKIQNGFDNHCAEFTWSSAASSDGASCGGPGRAITSSSSILRLNSYSPSSCSSSNSTCLTARTPSCPSSPDTVGFCFSCNILFLMHWLLQIIFIYQKKGDSEY